MRSKVTLPETASNEIAKDFHGVCVLQHSSLASLHVSCHLSLNSVSTFYKLSICSQRLVVLQCVHIQATVAPVRLFMHNNAFIY